MSPKPLDISPRLVHFGAALDADPIARYLKSVAPVCPFIEPAESAECLYAARVTVDCRTSDDIHPRMFEQIIPAIEHFRDRRRHLAEKTARVLLCHTVFFRMPGAFDAEANRLMTWPNWLGYVLKQLYTPKAVIFGFLRKGVPERSSTGVVVPASPLHGIVIRSQVIGADHRFFAGNEFLLSALSVAVDDGGDVHAGSPGGAPDVRDPVAIRSDNYFDRLRASAQAQLRAGAGGRGA